MPTSATSLARGSRGDRWCSQIDPNGEFCDESRTHLDAIVHMKGTALRQTQEYVEQEVHLVWFEVHAGASRDEASLKPHASWASQETSGAHVLLGSDSRLRPISVEGRAKRTTEAGL